MLQMKCDKTFKLKYFITFNGLNVKMKKKQKNLYYTMLALFWDSVKKY